MKKSTLGILLLFALGLTACAPDTYASQDTSQNTFEFEGEAQFFNGDTNERLLVVQGRCSINDESTRFEITCEDAPGEYTKYWLEVPDNVDVNFMTRDDS